MRFEERYQASAEKEAKRREEGKPPHQTILRSMNENKARLEATREIRRILLEEADGLETGIKKGVV